jgi:eukaryotic-like serine/threonine-protein kinase
MPQEILNYRIEGEIGEGGMSRVYKGVDPKTGQQVAIKELLPHLAHHDEVRQRFRREAQVMAILNHANIVRLIRYEEVGDKLYIVQEYVDGMNLGQYIGEHRGVIPETDAIRLIRQLLEALGYAHKSGVVHRDVKPSNILLTPTGEVKVLDFGIARIVGNEAGGFHTKTGTRIGTVAYMSPEQVNAKSDIDQRSDIYSTGVLLHHMLTGKPPYDMGTESEFEVQMKIVKEPLPRIREIYPGVSEKMQGIVDKATAKTREGRYQSCGEFLEALSESKQQSINPAVAVKPVPKAEPVKRKDPKPKSVMKIAVIAVCVIVLVFGIVGMIAGSHNVAEQPAEAPAAEAAPEPAAPPAVNVDDLIKNGLAYYNAGDYSNAYPLFKQAAEQGNAVGQNNLGALYDDGKGVEENNVEAAMWYRKAAEQGYDLGQINLGMMYYQGEGVARDYAEAVMWFRKAAEQGNANAQFSLGYMYYMGEGVEENDEEAAKWFQKAADQGNKEAKEYLLKMEYNNQK